MKPPEPLDEYEEYSRVLREGSRDPHYTLRLFVTGSTPRSARAIVNLRSILEKELQGHYDLVVIDVYQHPELAGREQILVTPTLVKILPPPARKIIGDLSDRERVLAGLDIVARSDPQNP